MEISLKTNIKARIRARTPVRTFLIFFFSQKNNERINLETNRNNNYYQLLVITGVSLMTFPRYGVHLDLTEFFGMECAIFTTLPASQVERLSVSKLSSTFAEC